MANEETVSVTFKLRPSLLDKVDRVGRSIGEDRSQFIRTALKEAIEARGELADTGEHFAPARLGVGGRPTHKYPEHKTQSVLMNDAPSGEKKPVKKSKSFGISPKVAKDNPAVAPNAHNLMPDPNLDPVVKAAADKLEALAAKRIKAQRKGG